MSFESGPDQSQDDRTPGPYSAWQVEVAFVADRSNDYEASRRFRLTFDRVEPGTPEHDALMTLWRLHDDRVLAHYRAAGHQTVLSNVMGRMQMGQTFSLTANEFQSLSDLAGALNYWAGQSPTYPLDIQPAIAYGDYARKLYTASDGYVTVFPFTMPASGLVHLAASEFQGQPWARLLTVSTVAGDLDAPIRSQGKVPDIYLTTGAEFPAGTPLFANGILTEAPIPGSTGSGFSIVWP